MTNSTIETFTRETMKTEIAKLGESQQLLFKRMYSHTDMDKDINDVIDQIPIDKLSWALTQVENSVAKHA